MCASSTYTTRCRSRWAPSSTLWSCSMNACRRSGSARPSSFLAFVHDSFAAVLDRADRLATAPQPKALADPMDEAAQAPARGWISPFEGWGGGRALGGADHLAEFGFAARAKKGRRPPVRRNVSASGPPWL